MKRLLATIPVLVLVSVPASPAAEPKANRAALAKSNSQFALELYGKLKDEPGNQFFSPYSISTALAMTYAGARGQTAEQMAKTLHYDLPPAALFLAFGGLIEEINGDPKLDTKKRGYQLSTANALWAQQGYTFLPEYLKHTKDEFHASVQEVNYSAPEAARKTINDWVEKETHDKIKDLIKPGMITVDTRLVLTNAIYFKGNWARQFKKDATKDEPFHVSATEKVKAPLMSQTSLFGYAETPQLQVLELPYVGQEISMVVLLPKKVDGLAALEKDLTVGNLTQWLDKAHQRTVSVCLPRFKTTAEYQLNKPLADLGMPAAFTERADFSGMNGGKESLQLSFVVHKAFVDVNEEGTEAAAATGVGVTVTSLPPPVPVFRADHPFVYVMRDKRSGSILFLGRLSKP